MASDSSASAPCGTATSCWSAGLAWSTGIAHHQKRRPPSRSPRPLPSPHASTTSCSSSAARCSAATCSLLRLLSLRPHRGLPVVRDDFFLSDCYVVVMDWIEGTSLDRLLAERGDPGLPHSTVIDCVTQVASALDHLHRQDPPVVHGDVKPSNL